MGIVIKFNVGLNVIRLIIPKLANHQIGTLLR